MTAVRDPYKDLSALIKDLTAMYNSSDDAACVRSIESAYQGIELLCEKRETSAKEIIKELTESVQQAEELTADPGTSRIHEIEVCKVTEVVSSTQENIRLQQSELRALKEQEQDLEVKQQELVDKSLSIETLSSIDEPTLRHILSLYALVSCINWNFETTDISGTVADPRGDVRSFCFNKSELSEYTLVNQLWELIPDC